MLLVEVSKSMGDLATAISKKNQELDRLKEQYENKLRLLDQYFSQLPVQGPASQDISGFVDTLQDLKGPITCPHCSNTLFDMLQDSSLVIVPKNRLKPFITDQNGPEKQVVISNPRSQAAQTIDGSPRLLQSITTNNQSKLKRTCSYCKEPGHSRARCFTRLTREPSSG